MKNYGKYMMMFLFVSMMIVPFGVMSSWEDWQDKSCDTDVTSKNNGITKCTVLSNNYKEPYCVNSSVDYALDCLWPSVTNKFSSIVQTPGKSAKSLGQFELKDVIEQYCKALLTDGSSSRIYFARPSDVHNGWDWEQTFDSRQSIFVYAFCSSFKDEDGMPFVDESKYSEEFLEKVFKVEDLVWTLKLKQKSWWKNICDLNDDPSINDCDMSVYATEIYSAIMSDLFKIKYAQVLDVDKAEEFDPEDKVLQFMSWYFDYYKKDFKELNSDYPFVQTIRVLQSNQQYYKRVLDTVKIINNSELADIALKKKCPKNVNMAWADFVACALHSSQWEWAAITPSFVTLLYNEMVNYRIFQQYVNMWIKKKALAMAGKFDERDINRFEGKSLDFQWYAGLQIEATKYALRWLVDFNMTYPFHIWLLLYQEIMKDFRDKHLSPIVTIFYSLSEKLQNVQLPN